MQHRYCIIQSSYAILLRRTAGLHAAADGIFERRSGFRREICARILNCVDKENCVVGFAAASHFRHAGPGSHGEIIHVDALRRTARVRSRAAWQVGYIMESVIPIELPAITING